MKPLTPIVIAATLVTLTLAEPAFYCESKSNSKLANFGTFDRYKGCGEACNCYVFELLCLTRDSKDNSVFTLESEGYDYANSCLVTECLCNTNSGWEQWSKPANNDVSLPSPLMFELPPYDELRSTAKSDFKDGKSVYYRGLFAELQKPHKRKDTIVNHPINDGKPEYLPAVITNSDVPTIDKGCS